MRSTAVARLRELETFFRQQDVAPVSVEGRLPMILPVPDFALESVVRRRLADLLAIRDLARGRVPHLGVDAVEDTRQNVAATEKQRLHARFRSQLHRSLKSVHRQRSLKQGHPRP